MKLIFIAYVYRNDFNLIAVNSTACKILKSKINYYIFWVCISLLLVVLSDDYKGESINCQYYSYSRLSSLNFILIKKTRSKFSILK